VEVTIARVVTRPIGDAERVVEELKALLSAYCELNRPGTSSRTRVLVDRDDFWTGLRSLAQSRLLIAKFHGAPEQTYNLTISYTESFNHDSYGSSHIRGLLAWLGLIAIPISRQAANCGQAASFWTIASAPPGVEILRIFWQSDREDTAVDESISVDAERAVVGRYEWTGDKPEENELLVDVQIAPSASILSTIGLAAILLYLLRYVYQGFPRPGVSAEDRTVLIGLGTILVTIPTTIAGALAYRGESFSRYASRGPRRMIALLSALGALLAVVVSLKGITGFAEVAAYVLSVYCVFVIGIFGYIQFGFRWRKSARTRWHKRTGAASPDRCRKHQTLLAAGFFAFWMLMVIIFAKAEIVLQTGHFFTSSLLPALPVGNLACLDLIVLEHDRAQVYTQASGPAMCLQKVKVFS